MDDEEALPWDLAAHIAAGMAAIARIESDGARYGPEPICHHFDAVDPVDPINVSVEATYGDLAPRFAALGVEFLPDRLEAWETARPEAEWLNKRLPAIFEAANASGLEYQGWTWEPFGQQSIGASKVQVINNRSS
jgi:hypothetical protein